MRTLHGMAIAVTALLAGCANGGPGWIDPHAAYPEASQVTSTPEPGAASLRIYTESYFFGPSDEARTPRMRYYTGYTIYDQAGLRYAYVSERNYEPARQPLPPGRYLILLDRPGRHAPVFWVAVQPDRSTDVRLPGAPAETDP